ncbi:MAG: hypothetical protein GDA39_02550 [Hyphomonadaceae bacterium]|nr:hypothetical protein [Hyphomonadaceae bacterium]MBC6411848.1 hypothetical protein [Hyphomonadaceae bacterium]
MTARNILDRIGKNPLVRPKESSGLTGCEVHGYYKHGSLETEGESTEEGIGRGRIASNFEGICPGESSGINVVGAINMARDAGPGHRIMIILCDYGRRHQSKIYNPEFLRPKGFPVPSPS